jgi:hypothetical protein
MAVNRIRKVLVSVPNLGKVATGLAIHLVKLADECGFSLCFDFPQVKPFTFARNEQLRVFLNATDADLMLMVDCDTVPPPGTVSRLANLYDGDEPRYGVIALPTPMWPGDSKSPCPNGGVLEENWLPDGGQTHRIPITELEQCNLVAIDRCGLACAMIDRDTAASVANEFAPAFEHTIGPRGNVIEEADYVFCRRVRRVGAGVWFFTPLGWADHLKTISLVRVLDLAGDCLNQERE